MPGPSLDGVVQPGSTCADQPGGVQCDGRELRVRVGTASQVSIRLGT